MIDKEYLDWLEEQLAPRKSMPTRHLLLLAVAILAALTLTLVLVVDRPRPGASTGHSKPLQSLGGGGLAASSSTGPLLVSLPVGSRLGHDLIYTAELRNATKADLTVEYPIRLGGASAGPATSSYADLTAAGQLVSFQHPRDTA